MFGSSGGLAAAVKRPGDGSERSGEPPAEREHPAHADPDQPARGRVQRRGAQREPELRELEERPEREDEHDGDREDPARPASRSRRRRRPRRSSGTAGPAGTRAPRPSRSSSRAPPSRMKRPIVRITAVITGPPSTRPDDRPLERDSARERDHERQRERDPVAEPVVDERPGDERRERRHLALREVHDPGRAVDDHDREREQRVDRRPTRAPRRPAAGTRPSIPQVRLPHRLVLGAARRSGPRARPGPPRARTRGSTSASASFAFCSTTRTARPSFSFSSPRIAKISRTTSGARPSEGSSRSSSLGRAISARAIASICCSPPESVPACWSRRSLEPREVRQDALVALVESVALRGTRRAGGCRRP